MNKYDIKRTCGEGSFAVVYEAVRRSDGVRVAVKKIKTPQPSWQACLHLRELRSFKTVGSHPHVVALRACAPPGVSPREIATAASTR